MVNGQKEYLLRWKGYGADSWVREEDCNSAVKKLCRLSSWRSVYYVNSVGFVWCSLWILLVSLHLFQPSKKSSISWCAKLGKNCLRGLLLKMVMSDQRPWRCRWIRDCSSSSFLTWVKEEAGLTWQLRISTKILPVGWSEWAFLTGTKCVVSREQPITVRLANQRKPHFDHYECPRW